MHGGRLCRVFKESAALSFKAAKGDIQDFGGKPGRLFIRSLLQQLRRGLFPFRRMSLRNWLLSSSLRSLLIHRTVPSAKAKPSGSLRRERFK
jgi:hypothetical protein